MSTLKSINEIKIYCTTDDQVSIYVGKNNDTRYVVDPDISIRWLNWLEILESSKTNQSLDETLRQVETLFHLTKLSK
jgi:hypothetical protein